MQILHQIVAEYIQMPIVKSIIHKIQHRIEEVKHLTEFPPEHFMSLKNARKGFIKGREEDETNMRLNMIDSWNRTQNTVKIKQMKTHFDHMNQEDSQVYIDAMLYQIDTNTSFKLLHD